MHKFRFTCQVYGILLLTVFPAPLLIAQKHLYLVENGLRNFSEIEKEMREYNNSQKSSLTAKSQKQYMRWKLTMESRLNENGEIFNYAAKNYEELRKFERNQPANYNQRATHGQWTNTTPPDFSPSGPHNGRLNCIAIDPTNSNIIYVGASNGGLWVSYNGGSTWSSLTDGMPTLGVSGIAIHPTTPNIIYILTGDGDGGDVPTMGIFRSTNGGNDWHPTSLQFDRSELRQAFKLIMHPTNPSIMYAGAGGGIFKTTNGWITHSSVLSTTARDIEFAPDDPNIMYATNWQNNFYKSTDGGDTWVNISQTLSGLPHPATDYTRMAIAVAPGYDNRLYVALSKDINPDTLGYHAIYYSDDHGDNFILLGEEYGRVGNQSGYNFDLIYEPNSNGVLYLGAVPLAKSTDHGVTFTNLPNSGPGVHADVHRILWHNNTLYVVTDGGVSKSTDGGQTFTNISEGLKIMQFYDIDVLGSEVMGGTQDNGTNQWNVGDQLGNTILGGDGFECIYDPDGDRLYYCTQDDRYRLTFPNDMDEINPPGHSGQWDASWIMHPTDHDTLYCAQDDLAISFNRGTTWHKTDPLFQENIRVLAQGTKDPDTMYASDRFQLKRSNNINDAFPGWINITGDWNLNNGANIGGIAVDPNNASRVWVTFNGYRDTLKVMYSSTAGQGGPNAWQNITDNLPNVPVLCIAYQPGSNDGIYIGTDIGVFYRNANLDEWIWYSNGLPKTRTEDLKIYGGYLYAGTFGRGMWRSGLYSNCPPELNLTQANDPAMGGNTGTWFYSAQNNIVSERIIDGGFGTSVNYRAGYSIRLDPGFHAKATNAFQADMSGCPD